MGCHNSLETYVSLFERLVRDIADCYCDSQPDLDWMKIQSRLATEGFSFLTKTLPKLGKAFDRALQGDYPFLSTGFKTWRGRPRLFGFLFERIFTSHSYLRSDADVGAIKHVRQLLFFFYKLELPYAPKTEKSVVDAFLSTEREIENLAIDGKDAVIKRARTLITRVLMGLDPRDIIPRHGPGAVSTGEKRSEKSRFSRIYEGLDQIYPFTEYFQVSVSQTIDQLRRMTQLQRKRVGTAKVVLVPKDSRGPRLISCEPLELQWIQQGQARKLVTRLESHPLTSGHVNFRDQTVNRLLAWQGSLTGNLVTLDMKDASDRVSLALVKELFQGTSWLSAILASRSAQTRLPDGRVCKLAKFAPMGSALCFPIEALCFYALAVSAIQAHKQKRLRPAMDEVFVYGDDIICNREDYPVVVQQLERFGLRFNTAKCCVEGFFRESCGCDAFKGVDVTPIRLKTTWSHRSKNGQQLAAYVELSNSLYVAGYYRTAEGLQQLVTRSYGAKNVPFVEYRLVKDRSSQTYLTRPGCIVGFYRPELAHTRENSSLGVRTRWNVALQRREVYGYSIVPRFIAGKEEEWDRLLRTLTCGSTGAEPGKYAVARSSRLKRTWGPLQ